MQETKEEKQKNHLWRYIIVIFIFSVISILSFLTYQNFGLLKAEISELVVSGTFVDMSGYTEGKVVEKKQDSTNNIVSAVIQQDSSVVISTEILKTASTDSTIKEDNKIAKPTEEIKKINDSATIQSSTEIKKVDNSAIGDMTLSDTSKTEVALVNPGDSVVNRDAGIKVSGSDFALVKDFYIPNDLKAVPGGSILIPVKNGKKIDNLTAVSFKFVVNPSSSLTIDNIQKIEVSGPAVFKGEYPEHLQTDASGNLWVEFNPLDKKYTLGANSTLFYIKANVKSGLTEGNKIQISIDSDPKDIFNSSSYFSTTEMSSPPTVDPGYITIDLCANFTASSNASCSKGVISCNTGYVGTPPSCLKMIEALISGDINGDGKLTMLDVIALFKIANGSLSATADQIKKGDMDGDGKITMFDVIIAFKKL